MALLLNRQIDECFPIGITPINVDTGSATSVREPVLDVPFFTGAAFIAGKCVELHRRTKGNDTATGDAVTSIKIGSLSQGTYLLRLAEQRGVKFEVK